MQAAKMIFEEQERVEIVDVTPDMAQRLLNTSNHGNRKIRPAVVNKYARAMSAGDWRFSPEAISISKTGRLLNGQHRMSAVVASGRTIRFMFALGFDDDVFEVLDRGVARTAADALKIDKKLAEVAALLVRCGQHNFKRATVTDHDIKRAAEKIREAHDFVIEKCGTNRAVFSSAPFRLACVARIMSGDGDYALNIYRNLVMTNIEELPPIGYAAIRAAMNGRLTGGGGAAQVNKLCAAWDITNPSSAQKSKLYIARRQVDIDEITKAVGHDCA